ncbi:melanocortin receptor 3 [Nematostella vectensis]|uniref:melanocortin receptor 3 n=1 Tax=Nematostella vectensis TaxID=45351 RepID=UPI002076F97B|nr:melanocortin receptor 3 [Nematostella vectensis]
MDFNYSCDSFPGWASYAVSLQNSTYFLVTMFGTLTLPSIFFNALILITLARIGSLQTPSNLFLCNLAVSDLGVVLISQPVGYAWKLLEFLSPDTQNTCGIANVFLITATLFYGVSLLTITCASIDRYLALYLHLSYNSTVTCKRVLVVCGGSWLLMAFISVITSFGVHAFHIAAAIFITICLPIMAFCYYKIYKVLKYHHVKINQSLPSAEGRVPNLLRYKRSVIGLFYVLVLMVVSFAPFGCVAAVFEIIGLSESLVLAWNVTACLAYVNCILNPLIYYWKMRDLRSSVNQTVSLICTRRSLRQIHPIRSAWTVDQSNSRTA